MRHKSGNTFVWQGIGEPCVPGTLVTDSEQWEVQCMPARADAEPWGFARIDGSMCIIYLTVDGLFLAQLLNGGLNGKHQRQLELPMKG